MLVPLLERRTRHVTQARRNSVEFDVQRRSALLPARRIVYDAPLSNPGPLVPRSPYEGFALGTEHVYRRASDEVLRTSSFERRAHSTGGTVCVPSRPLPLRRGSRY